MMNKTHRASLGLLHSWVLISAALLLPAAGFAQVLGIGGEPAKNAAMVKLFGSNTAFSARAEFQLLDQNQKEAELMPFNYACLDGSTRVEIDMNQVRSREEPALAPATLKRLNMDETVIVTRPDKKLTYSIFPRAKAYAEIALNKEESAALAMDFKVDKSSLGKETVDGHECDKEKVTLTPDKGPKQEVVVWVAADLKDFPVQVQMKADATGTMVIKFHDVKLTKPDAKLFEAPSGLTKYDSVEALRDALIKAGSPTAAKK